MMKAYHNLDKGGLEFLNTKNSNGDFYINEFDRALTRIQESSLEQDIPIPMDTTSTTTSTDDQKELFIDLNEGWEPPKKPSIQLNERKIQDMRNMLDLLALSGCSLLFSKDKLNPSFLNVRAQDLADINGVRYHERDTFSQMLVRDLPPNMEKDSSLNSVLLLIYFVKLASQHYVEGGEDFLNGILSKEFIDSVPNLVWDSKVLSNWVHQSKQSHGLTIEPTKDLVVLRRWLENFEIDIDDETICSLIENGNLELLLFAEEQLSPRLVDKLLKWRSQSVIVRAGKVICDKEESVLHLAIRNLLNKKRIKSSLSLYGTIIFLIKLAFDHYQSDEASFLKARNKRGLLFWELIPDFSSIDRQTFLLWSDQAEFDHAEKQHMWINSTEEAGVLISGEGPARKKAKTN